ncbi:hypothetical protein EPUS_06840 [Endocarpon pusillum Z07020]|uniref:BZIP domain-containing protein n=1 Tax=Endocarpon pusillum (strain Z07020 / HMAS-L-300199) TaxID=1263415 RepID=U1GH62_ENDPU|nr:uncharacterized protein EPUS_06840 [Endocarpon pusillum Z07020]ERF71458.1 hypothetical protein EPUS_06840 [Endocarpon pusillum Z07020]
MPMLGEESKNHRERKETYIKSLEQQVLQLLNQQATAAAEKRAVERENTMLQGLLHRHGIPIPNEAGGFGPTASISMLDVPGGQQRLQVTMPETTSDYFATFDTSRSSLPRGNSSPHPPDAEMRQLSSGASGVSSIPPPAFQTRLPSESVQIHPPTTPQKSLPPLPPSAPRQPIPHPYGLDAPQIGIDFVLALENPCLHHTSNDLQSAETYGHILTTHAPLLTHRPRAPQPTSSWTIPAAEIERLLNLSSQLNLAGEITPVQAWSRIRSYPGFEKLNLDQLETLEKALLKEVQCYGFGAVINENAFDNILQQCFYGLQ